MTPESPTPSGATLCPFFDKPTTWEEAYAKKMIECVGLYEKLAAERAARVKAEAELTEAMGRESVPPLRVSSGQS